MEDNKEKQKNNDLSIIIPKVEAPLKNISASFTMSEQLQKKINIMPRFDNIYQQLGISNTLSNTLTSIVNEQKKLFLNRNIISSITQENSAFMEAIKRITEVQKNLVSTIIEKINISPFFEGLSKTIEEARNNPYSFLSWYNYYEKLSEYFWVYPYDMKPEQLHKILSTVSSEQEFDRYMAHYFSKKKIKELLLIIKREIPRRHRKMITQIEKAYDMKLYALANNSLMTIIDDLLSYYLYNKGCTQRNGIFEPIVEELRRKHVDIDDGVLITLMVNSYINKLYDSIDFNVIQIDTHKKSRRGMSAHGKFTSNERSDFIMLINTVYHLLMVQEVLKKYKGRIFRNNKTKSFFIPKGEEYKKLKTTVDKEIEKKKKELENQIEG